MKIKSLEKPVSTISALFILLIPAVLLSWGLGVLDTRAAPAAGTSITIIKEAAPADGMNFNFQTNAISYLNKWGVNGSESGAFDFPRGLAADGDGNIYVADGFNRRIQVFDKTGVFQMMWGRGVDGGEGFEICTSSCQAGIFAPGSLAISVRKN